MLSILYGENSAINEREAYKRIEQVAKSGRCAWLLVPEQFSLTAERFVIEKFGVSAQKNVKVITFSRLCNLVLSKLGPLRLKYIDGAGRQIIAAATVRAAEKNMTALAPAIKRRGFATELVGLISEMKRYGVTEDILNCGAENIEDEELSAKLKDIACLCEIFNKQMEDKAADAEDNLAIITKKLCNFDMDDGCLFIMHFNGFTPVEYNALSEIMKKVDVCAVMCLNSIDSPSDLFLSTAKTCRKLTKEAKLRGVETETPFKIPDKDTDTELDFLRRNYFADYPLKYNGKCDKIKIYKVSNAYREVEAAADLILKLCRMEKRRFSDFLILARNPEAYERTIPAVFASRNIDVFLDVNRSILTKPLTEMICAAVDILAYGYSYERVMTIGRSGLTAAEDEDIDIFENYILAADPSHAVWDKEEWDYNIEGFDLNRVNMVRNIVCAYPKRLESFIQGRKSASDICGAILKVLDEEKTADKINDMCRYFSENNMVYLADEYRQVWNSIISVLAQISALMDQDMITWKDFSDLFKHACENLKVGITPKVQDSVTFAGIDRFRAQNPPVVIVLGMTDGVFPAGHTTEGLISDGERKMLEKEGITLAPGAEEKNREEQQLIYSVLAAPRDRLYLFVPMLGTDGGVLYPSVVALRCKKIMPQAEEYNPDFDGDVLRGAEGADAAFSVLCLYLSKVGGNPDLLQGLAADLYDKMSKDKRFSQRLKKITNSEKTNEGEKLTRSSVKAIYGDIIHLSATKLEKYNDCAFSYFLRYGLCASERMSGGLDSRDTGSIQHRALYLYFTELKNSGMRYDEITYEDCSERVCKIVEETAKESSELLYESSFYFKYIVSRMQGIVTRTAWETIKFYRSGNFRPYGYEIKIDTDGEIPEIEIKADDGKDLARLRGFVDRADMAVIDGKTYVSIIDYKSSRTDLDKTLAEAGVKLQPLLYSDIVCKRIGASPAAMLYMRMTDPIVKAEDIKGDTPKDVEKAISAGVNIDGWINNDKNIIANYSCGENGESFLPSKKNYMSEGEMLERVDSANQKIREAANGIYNGEITPNPFICKNHSACTYCPYGLSCGKNMK